MTIILSAETESRLLAEAARRGVKGRSAGRTIDRCRIAAAARAQLNQPASKILNAWGSPTANRRPGGEIARRQADLRNSSGNSNQTRLRHRWPGGQDSVSMRHTSFWIHATGTFVPEGWRGAGGGVPHLGQGSPWQRSAAHRPGIVHYEIPT